MSAVAIVINRLLAASPVTTAVAQKVYPVLPPQNTQLPLIVVHLIGTVDHPNLSGAGAYYRSTVQVDSIAGSGGAAIDLGEKVITALNGIIKATVSGCNDVDILLDGGSDFTEYDEQATSFRRVTRFMVHWRRA